MTSKEAIKRLRQETCPATYCPDFDKEECLQVIEKELKAFEILKEEFSIEAYESALNHKVISIYSDFDKYAVVKVVSQEKHDLIKKVLANE